VAVAVGLTVGVGVKQIEHVGVGVAAAPQLTNSTVVEPPDAAPPPTTKPKPRNSAAPAPC
jgi:hypothetical protein